MKNIFLALTLIVSTLAFTSCGSEDDSLQQDKLVGKWKIIQEFENGEPIEIDVCEAEDVLDYKADGSFTFLLYNDDDGSCVQDETENGTWSNEGSGNYKFTDDTETYTEKIIFENDTFSLTDIDGLDTYKTVYKRQ